MPTARASGFGVSPELFLRHTGGLAGAEVQEDKFSSSRRAHHAEILSFHQRKPQARPARPMSVPFCPPMTETEWAEWMALAFTEKGTRCCQWARQGSRYALGFTADSLDLPGQTRQGSMEAIDDVT